MFTPDGLAEYARLDATDDAHRRAWNIQHRHWTGFPLGGN
jgi:hypothetical protein